MEARAPSDALLGSPNGNGAPTRVIRHRQPAAIDEPRGGRRTRVRFGPLKRNCLRSTFAGLFADIVSAQRSSAGPLAEPDHQSRWRHSRYVPCECPTLLASCHVHGRVFRPAGRLTCVPHHATLASSGNLHAPGCHRFARWLTVASSEGPVRNDPGPMATLWSTGAWLGGFLERADFPREVVVFRLDPLPSDDRARRLKRCCPQGDAALWDTALASSRLQSTGHAAAVLASPCRCARPR